MRCGVISALLLFLPAIGLVAVNPLPAEMLGKASAAEARFDSKEALALFLQVDVLQPGDAANQPHRPGHVLGLGRGRV